jgi:hypothetical protein
MGLPVKSGDLQPGKTAGSTLPEIGYNTTAFILWLGVAAVLALMLYLLIRKVLARLDVIAFSLRTVKDRSMSVIAKVHGKATEAEAIALLKSAQRDCVVEKKTISEPQPLDKGGACKDVAVFSVQIPTALNISSIEKVEI